MSMSYLNCDLRALAEPRSRCDCSALAREIIAELEMIEGHFEKAIAAAMETANATV